MKTKLFTIGLIYTILLIPFNSHAQFNNITKSIEIGEFTIYSLQQSEFYIPASGLMPINNNIKPSLEKDSIHAPANVFLITSAEQNILVDVGIVTNDENRDKNITNLIKNIGLEPNQIDMVLITHFHFDHIGGLIDSKGNATFPNATVYVSQEENDYWFNDSTKLLAKHKTWAKQVPNFFSPYKDKGRYKMIKNNETIADGIHAILAPGHTVGHTIYSFESENKTLWCIGDLIHMKELQFDHPRLGIIYDTKPEIAVKSRMKYFKNAAQNSIIMAASHDFNFFKIKIEDDKIIEIPVD